MDHSITHTVSVGSRVSLHDLRNRDAFDVIIIPDTTPEWSDDIFPDETLCITVNSPIAHALLGARCGEIVNWSTPSGVSAFRITAITRAPQSVSLPCPT